MANEDSKGFVVSSKTLNYLLALLAVLGIGWKIVGYIKDNEFRNDIQDTYIAQDKDQKKEIVEELKQLNTTVSQLVFIIQGVDEMRKSAQLTPKPQ